MGMWIGISVLTCAELLELLIVTFHDFLLKFKKGRNLARNNMVTSQDTKC